MDWIFSLVFVLLSSSSSSSSSGTSLQSFIPVTRVENEKFWLRLRKCWNHCGSHWLFLTIFTVSWFHGPCSVEMFGHFDNLRMHTNAPIFRSRNGSAWWMNAQSLPCAHSGTMQLPFETQQLNKMMFWELEPHAVICRGQTNWQKSSWSDWLWLSLTDSDWLRLTPTGSDWLWLSLTESDESTTNGVVNPCKGEWTISMVCKSREFVLMIRLSS